MAECCWVWVRDYSFQSGSVLSLVSVEPKQKSSKTLIRHRIYETRFYITHLYRKKMYVLYEMVVRKGRDKIMLLFVEQKTEAFNHK